MYLDEQGQQQPIVMGSYGIGPARIAAAAIEQRHDADGIVWPWAIAPFQVHLVPIAGKDSAQPRAAEAIYGELERAGFDVLLDDRDERAGVKFKDADLLGCPIRVTVGQGLVKEGIVEVEIGPPAATGRCRATCSAPCGRSPRGSPSSLTARAHPRSGGRT